MAFFRKGITCVFLALSGILFLSQCAMKQEQAISSPTTVSTFHNISIYWSPEGGSMERDLLVRFREYGADDWHDALPIKFNPISGSISFYGAEVEHDKQETYRGSIVNLKPATEYEIKVMLEETKITETILASTWSEDFPIGKTIKTDNSNQTLSVTQSGTPDGYLLIDGTGTTIDVDNKHNHCINVTGDYLIIRGFTLTGARQHGIFIMSDCHDVIIEQCDISNWGDTIERGNGFGTPAGAIYSPEAYTSYPETNATLKRIVVQRNRIHHPRYDANSWAEFNTENDSYHPYGPQAVMFFEPGGNIVIRYNEVWSDKDHYYNDILGWGLNMSNKGFPGPDSDIYGNYLANCWDDAIEVEGGGRNIRIWNNYMDSAFVPIATVKNTIGPLYIWQNVSGRSESPPGSKYGEYGLGFKSLEYTEDNQYLYLFNNTILQLGGLGAGGLGTVQNNDPLVNKVTTRNNIFHVREANTNSIGTKHTGTADLDYDLFNKGVPEDQEQHGIKGVPIYSSQFGFDLTTMTGNFQLAEDSPGCKAGVVVTNFCEIFTGDAPDMGAHQSGKADMQFGVKADYSIN